MANALRGSVGLHGNNWYSDIATVQDMLNQIAVAYGGAAPPFFTLGSYSQQLVDAIRRFQSVNHLVSDGRVDKNGPSFRKMLTLLNKPLPPDGPPSSPSVGPPSTPGGQPSPPSDPQGVNLDKAFKGFRSSPWKFTGSAGGSGSISVIGASGGYLSLHNDKSGEDQTLYYGAAGGGISLAPGGFQYSTASMPSGGFGHILVSYRLQRDLEFSDMQGLGGVIGGTAMAQVVPGMPAGIGGSLSIYLLGIDGWLAPAMLLLGGVGGAGAQMINLAAIADAIGMMWGELKGTPDVGVSVQNGYFR